GGDERMFSEIFGTEQSLFFGGDGGENHRPRWRVAGTGGHARELQKNSAAGGVVHSTVVDLVALAADIDTQMIVMRGEEHGFVLQVGVAARAHGYHVARNKWSQSANHVGFELYVERNGLEVARLRL